MSSQRFAALAVLCGTLAINSWVAFELADLGPRKASSRVAYNPQQATAIAKDSADGISVPDTGIIDPPVPDPHEVMPPIAPSAATTLASAPDPVQEDGAALVPTAEGVRIGSIGGSLPDSRQMPPLAAHPVATALASAPDPVQEDAAALAPTVEVVRIGSIDSTLPGSRQMLPLAAPSVPTDTPDPVQDNVEATALPVDVVRTPEVDTDAPLSREMAPPATPPMRLVSLFRPEALAEDLKPPVRRAETPNECLVAEICIDEYLWSLYEGTPKVDTNKVTERIKATIKKKGKTRTVTRTITKYVVGDFTWKDPIAAQRAGMSIKDYVIGGMDRGFKLKLYHALRAMDDAGLMPGITSAFRDDYRQSIASGNKAASDSSYHGGSRRGGYGHGLAADIVSVKGETRLQRFASTVELWKWIDAREKELGIGRPYLNRDPPHVGPLDGKEYAAKRGGAKAKLVGSATSRNRPVAAGANPSVTKPETKAGLARVGSI
jgi:hypothetical protein